jgi:outer membrane autotransporter protein
VGVIGGYEHFDFTSQALGSRLKGDAFTTGAFVGWRLTQQIRFDATATWSHIGAGAVADTAFGSFTGQRWLLASGLTGTYGWQSLIFEPSARIYALWEHDDAFVDSLGTAQGANDFATGRASGGLKAIYPWAWSSALNLAPYVGLYGDYYFSRENTPTVALPTVLLLQGWAARVTGGVTMSLKSGATLNLGAEYSGLGSDTQIWTFIARGSVPF